MGAKRIFLEVRETNLPALRLYERLGFKPAGRRPGYYTNPPADALLFERRLAGQPETSANANQQSPLPSSSRGS